MYLTQKIVIQTLLLFSLAFCSCISFASTPEDPWEKFNRSVYQFNDSLDKAILKPVAEAYDEWVPKPIKRGTGNFFSNVGEIRNTFNNLLQGKMVRSVSSATRFVVNSTVGLLGVFDVATVLGVRKYDEDFGQTLGYWGVNSGPYLVLPLFGPSTLRDGSSLVVDFAVDNHFYSEFNLNLDEELSLQTLDIIQTRALLLSAEGLIIGDPYTFVRDVYLQTREYDIHDGNSLEDFAEEDLWESDGWDDDFYYEDG